MTQLALEFGRTAHQGPAVARHEVEQLKQRLRGRGWQTAAELGASKESDRRILRAIAEESGGHIISGQKGYKLTIEATVTEIAETGWMKRQGEKMIGRWLEIQRVAHPILAGARR